VATPPSGGSQGGVRANGFIQHTAHQHPIPHVPLKPRRGGDGSHVLFSTYRALSFQVPPIPTFPTPFLPPCHSSTAYVHSGKRRGWGYLSPSWLLPIFTISTSLQSLATFHSSPRPELQPPFLHRQTQLQHHTALSSPELLSPYPPIAVPSPAARSAPPCNPASFQLRFSAPPAPAPARTRGASPPPRVSARLDEEDRRHGSRGADCQD